MTCTCGFDNTPLPGDSEPTKCGGCGTPLRPDSDDPMHSDMPAPGFQVMEHSDPHIVTESDVEAYPELEGVLVIHTLETDWGRGIGAEPYGYFTRKRVQTEKADEPCEECGCELERYSFSQGHAGIAGGDSVTCVACDHTKQQNNWA